MRFADLEKGGPVAPVLVGMVDSGRVPHAIMLHEDDGGGAVPLAIAFIQYLFCRSRADGDSCGVCPCCNKVSKLIHPDVHHVFPVKSGTLSSGFASEWRDIVLSNPAFKESDFTAAMGAEGKQAVIAVPEAKAMLESLALTPLERGYRAYVIYLPEKMNQEAANRLLKVIEEPPVKTVFVMVTHAPEKVLQTIASRCQRIRVAPSGAASSRVLNDTEQGFADIFSRLMDALLRHSLLDALEVGDEIAALPSRDVTKAFCRYAVAQLRLVFLRQQGLDALVDSSGCAVPGLDRWAAGCRKNFPRAAMTLFDKAHYQVERNVNAKIVMTDLVDRLSASI